MFSFLVCMEGHIRLSGYTLRLLLLELKIVSKAFLKLYIGS